jgi:hypothetical protein
VPLVKSRVPPQLPAPFRPSLSLIGHRHPTTTKQLLKKTPQRPFLISILCLLLDILIIRIHRSLHLHPFLHSSTVPRPLAPYLISHPFSLAELRVLIAGPKPYTACHSFKANISHSFNYISITTLLCVVCTFVYSNAAEQPPPCCAALPPRTKLSADLSTHLP